MTSPVHTVWPNAPVETAAGAGPQRRTGTVIEVMSENPRTVRPDADLAEVAGTMLRHADVGAAQCRGVVHPVPGHGHDLAAAVARAVARSGSPMPP